MDFQGLLPYTLILLIVMYQLVHMIKRLNPILSCSAAWNKYTSCCANAFISKYFVLECYPCHQTYYIGHVLREIGILRIISLLEKHALLS